MSQPGRYNCYQYFNQCNFMFYRTLTLTFISLIFSICASLTANAQNNTPYYQASVWDRAPSKIRHFTTGGDPHNQRNTNPDSPAPYESPSGTELYRQAISQAELLDAQGRTHHLFFQPPSQQRVAETSSALEKMYKERVVNDLQQFGYDLFGIPTRETETFLSSLGRDSYSIPTGAVADDFILDIGDQLEVVFTGQRSDRNIYNINTQGQLLIKDFPPIPAAGRSIGQVRISVEAAARNLHNTQAYISLASVRQIGVLVVGHVRKPGRKNLTVFHTVLDALMETGGVKKTGSLRQIKLVRDGRSQLIDIYSLLMYGATNADMQLRDGDRIIIPPIGPTIAVTGEVKRPGIFEILPRLKGMRHQSENASEKLSLNDALDLAGGVLVSGQNRFLKISNAANGQEQVSEIHDAFAHHFGDGSILMVSKGKEKRAGMVELVGHTRKAGIHALSEAPALGHLLSDHNVLGDDIYPLIGVIERYNPEQLSRQYIDFPLKLVMSGDYDRKLQEDDVVHLFSNAQIRALAQDKNRHRQNRGQSETTHQDNAFIMASYRGNGKRNENGNGSGNGGRASTEQGSAYTDASTINNTIDDEVLATFLKERAVFVRGAVRQPGLYPVATGATLDSVLAVAGGLALEANVNNIEVTSNMQGEHLQKNRRIGTRRIHVNVRETNPKDIQIGPGDSIRVNQKFDKISDKSVLIIGEVQNPGRYDLIPGDKVSDLLQRAGGLTRQAYPAGAIFSRESERRSEEARYRAAARDLERALAISLEKNDSKSPNATQVAMARDLAEELRSVEAVGRITVETDPGILTSQPEVDMLLESGDRIFIPKRPMSVRVSGEILSPASLQFRERKKLLDYIHEAGGFTYHADKDRTFVLYPDGSAQPLQVSSWNQRATFIPPGSTIVVPRDPKPFDFIESAKDISQILSNLAVTAIFLDDVRDD